MFHHFHDDLHPVSQGSISANQLERIISHVGRANILGTEDWSTHVAAGTLAPNHLCLTFDDNLLCQFDVALPVLQKHQITSFWFIHTSVFEGELEKLEIYRHFRHEYFQGIDDFYSSFFHAVAEGPYGADMAEQLESFDPDTYNAQYTFYTRNDRKFRFVRDRVLGSEYYDVVMARMISDKGIEISEIGQKLWMTPDHLRILHQTGHVVGLHSHTHPTKMGELDPTVQRVELETNRNVLTAITGSVPKTMSHPCGSYSVNTLEILSDMEIELGFRDNMAMEFDYSNLEQPREDHSNLLREIKDIGV